MAATPLIKPITTDQGSFYAFQSAINHSNLINSQQGYKFSFSKYALIKIPTFGAMQVLSNRFNFNAIGESPLIDPPSYTDQNYWLAESFQNYCLNLESILLSQPNYNANLNHTIAERVFFKWMKESGAMRFRTADSLEYVASSNNDRFTEETEYTATLTKNWEYSKVVKLIAEIPAVTSQKVNNVYTQLYIHADTKAGSTPTILFKSEGDDNYKANTVYNNIASSQNVEYLCGRQYNDTHPFGLSMSAYYDYDNGGVTTQISTNIESPTLADGNWFNETAANSYHTDDAFNNPANLYIEKTYNGSTVDYVRSYLDGIGIDWNLTNYKLFVNDPTLNSFGDFNGSYGSKDFQYNAILVYYDLTDISDPTKTVTNLYGIQFLDKVTNNGADFIIPLRTKYKPNKLNNTYGTADLHLINLKLDTTAENVSVERSINDYNNISMQAFMESFTATARMATLFESYLPMVTTSLAKMEELSALIMNDDNKQQLLNRIKIIETSLNASSALIDNMDVVQHQISDLLAKYNDIMENKTTIDVRTNIDKFILNSMIEYNQAYNVTSVVDLTSPSYILSKGLTIDLQKYSNYFKHENLDDVKIELEADLNIYINDGMVNWKAGQTLDIVFNGLVETNGFSVRVFTDRNNVGKSGVYSNAIAVWNGEFSNDAKPYFKITCLDATTLSFTVDKLR